MKKKLIEETKEEYEFKSEEGGDDNELLIDNNIDGDIQ